MNNILSFRIIMTFNNKSENKFKKEFIVVLYYSRILVCNFSSQDSNLVNVCI